MEQTPTKVDWHLYAEKYDMLLAYNPFYQTLREEILNVTQTWPIEDEDLIADVGAGTGNYSVPLAEHFPQARVIHIDNNTAMNERALEKKREKRLENIDIFEQGIEQVHLQENSLKALLSIHALYTFPDPLQGLRKMYSWLEVGGVGILVDLGRIVNVIDWQLAIGWQLLTKYGLSQTLKIFKEGKVVSKQNQYIRQMQRAGKFWTHSPKEFCQMIEQAGFTVIESHICFRGLSDMAIVTKT